MESIQNEIISFLIIAVVVLALALLTVKLEKKYK
jgi:hypothetical protein